MDPDPHLPFDADPVADPDTEFLIDADPNPQNSMQGTYTTERSDISTWRGVAPSVESQDIYTCRGMASKPGEAWHPYPAGITPPCGETYNLYL